MIRLGSIDVTNSNEFSSLPADGDRGREEANLPFGRQWPPRSPVLHTTVSLHLIISAGFLLFICLFIYIFFLWVLS